MDLHLQNSKVSFYNMILNPIPKININAIAFFLNRLAHDYLHNDWTSLLVSCKVILKSFRK